ncbi:DUF3265 domain-containing protein [Vibrio cincinnatiensis]
MVSYGIWCEWKNGYNKRFKRDNQRVAFLLCVGFCDYSVMRKVGSSVGCPLTGRYVTVEKKIAIY